MRIISCFLFFLILVGKAKSQVSKSYEIGDVSPDFKLSNLINYSSKTASFSDFKGKIIIVDFWNTSCAPCIVAFPRLDSLQKKYADRLQIIAVSPEKENVIKDFVKRMRTIKKIDFSILFEAEDNELKTYFRHVFVPHQVWIGPDGIIKATTDGKELNAFHIESLLKNGSTFVKIKKDKSVIGPSYWIDKPLEIRNLLIPLFLNDQSQRRTGVKFTSVLTPYLENALSVVTYPVNSPRLLVINGTVSNLFAVAFGLISKERTELRANRIFCEISDPEICRPGSNTSSEAWNLQNKYCYEILSSGYSNMVSDSGSYKFVSNSEISNQIRKDIEYYFGYTAGFEKRWVKCFVFNVFDSLRLKAADGNESSVVGPGFLGAKFTNMSFSKIVSQLSNYLRSSPVLNEAGYTGKINIELEAKLTNSGDVAKELLKYGISLTEECREIDMLIIRDANKKNIQGIVE